MRRLSLWWTVLTVFTLTAISLMVWQVRQGFEHVVTYQPSRPGEQLAWTTLEEFWENPQKCTRFFRGTYLGKSLIGGFADGPEVGQEWRGTGWVVKDIYVLDRQDEAAWLTRKPGDGPDSLYIKVSLIPRPKLGVRMSLSYLLHAPSVSRIFTLKAKMGNGRGIASQEARPVWVCEAKKNPQQAEGSHL